MTQVLEQHRQQNKNYENEKQLLSVAPSCEGKTGLFFSEKTADMRAAQLICATCPMRTPCTQQARERPPFAGVWGGIIFVNGEELLTKRGRGRPRKSEELDNARLLKVLDQSASDKESSDSEDSGQDLSRQIA